jgi:hypothetical protein
MVSMVRPDIRDEAMRAFIGVLDRVEPTGPSWCTDWSAHEITAHVAAAAQERASLIEEHLRGRPGRATRSWEEREPPFRALAGVELRERRRHPRPAVQPVQRHWRAGVP